MRMQVSIIIICDRPEIVTGSGCCGKLEGDKELLGTDELFKKIRVHQEQFGVLHRTVRRLFRRECDDGRVALASADPRNQLYLWPKLIGDAFRYRPGFRSALVTAFQFFSLPAVIVNGRVLTRRGETLTPDQLCHAVSQILEANSSASIGQPTR